MTTVADRSPALGPAVQPDRARRILDLAPAVGAFVASRLIVLLALYAAPALKPGYVRNSFFSDWDATHYLNIARHGYPQLFVPPNGFDATAAFFPLLPMLTRALSTVTGLSVKTSGILVANAATLLAACVIWILAKRMIGREAASIAVALISFWPASFILSMVYSDGLLLLFAAACLLALYRERWIWASVFGFLAALSRPNGIVLCLCAGWAGYQSIRQRRWQWTVILPIIAPLAAFGGYCLYLWAELGTITAWFKAEKRGWHANFDFGHRWLSDISVALHHPTSRIDLLASTVAGLIGIALLIWMIQSRMPAILSIYSAGILILALGSGFGGSIPRFVIDAFPLFFVPAARLKLSVNMLIIGLSGGAMAILFGLVELSPRFVP